MQAEQKNKAAKPTNRATSPITARDRIAARRRRRGQSQPPPPQRPAHTHAQTTHCTSGISTLETIHFISGDGEHSGAAVVGRCARRRKCEHHTCARVRLAESRVRTRTFLRVCKKIFIRKYRVKCI